jgi:phage/plasmid-associated DNA primase
MALYEFLTNKKCHVGVLCFDGLMVNNTCKFLGEQKTTTDQRSYNLRLCEKEIADKTGYNIKLEIKPMDTKLSFKIPKFSKYVSSDKDCQEKLFKIEGSNKFKFCNGELFIYNEDTGIYDNRIESLWYYLSRNSKYFEIILYANEKTGEVKTDNYGESSNLMKKVVPFINMAARDEEWLQRTDDSSLGYLLFKDGIYNMVTSEFKPGFDPNIVFHVNVPWKFPRYDKEKVKYAMDISFNRLFKDPKPMIAALARAIAGDITLKSFYFCPGDSNSGKSRFVKMLISAFGNCVGSFNAESLAVSSKFDTKDEGAKNRWLYLNRYKRILTSNEIKMDRDLDGNYVKKCSSGGDQIIGRTHNKEEVSFTLHGTVFCMLNDIPNIFPNDLAVGFRSKYQEFPYVFVSKDKVNEAPHYKELDPDLDKIIKTKKFIKGFIHIILDGYKDFLENGMPEFDDEVKQQWNEDCKQNDVIINAFKETYVITNDPNDLLNVRDVRKFKEKSKEPAFASVSITKFNKILRKELKLKEKKDNSNRYWVGVKEKKWGDADDVDDNFAV